MGGGGVGADRFALVLIVPSTPQSLRDSSPQGEPYLSILTNNRLDQADELGFGAVDGLVVVVFGHEPDLAAAAAQTLNSGLVPDAGDHDLV